MKPFIYKDHIIYDSNYDETGRFLVSENYYKEELKNFDLNMGVYTTADRKRDEAKEYLQNAYNCVMEATDKSNQWAEHYSDEYMDTLFKVAEKIRKLKRKL